MFLLAVAHIGAISCMLVSCPIQILVVMQCVTYLVCMRVMTAKLF
jgi:hypothetical protein